jgi:hypothetical protein
VAGAKDSYSRIINELIVDIKRRDCAFRSSPPCVVIKMEFTPFLKQLFIGYGLTVVVETVVLIIGLSKRNSLAIRVFAGAWLTACSYPAVNVIIPIWFKSTDLYLVEVATSETFAAVAECALFWAAFSRYGEPERRSMRQDLTTITLANIASFGFGELLIAAGPF